MAEIEALWPALREQADRLAHRENTDFLGRMLECTMEADEICDGGICPENRRAEYGELMLELAALALAQALMGTWPSMEGPPS